MLHGNASLAPMGRLKLAKLIVDEGWSYRRAAARFQVSPATAKKWAGRYRAGESMDDHSSRPRTIPTKTPLETEQQILTLRISNQWGPHRIGYALGIPRSTVGRVLARHEMPLLKQLDRMTGESARTPAPVRYEMAAPGELVHVDIKKLGRIPDGGDHRAIGRQAGRRTSGVRGHGRGYADLHHAIDSYSRVVYSEILDDERKETAVAFWHRANAFFTSIGVTVTGIMTDNGSCYRSRIFAMALGPAIRHRFTRPYRPQTNGKVERFNRTLLAEWAYATTYLSDAARAATYQDWIHWYNHHQHHTGIGGLTPAQRVHNLVGTRTRRADLCLMVGHLVLGTVHPTRGTPVPSLTPLVLGLQ